MPSLEGVRRKTESTVPIEDPDSCVQSKTKSDIHIPCKWVACDRSAVDVGMEVPQSELHLVGSKATAV